MNPQGEYCTKPVKAFAADRKRMRPAYKAVNCLGTGPHNANGKHWIAVHGIDGRVFWQEYFPGHSFVPATTAKAAGAPLPGATSAAPQVDIGEGVTFSDFVVDADGSASSAPVSSTGLFSSMPTSSGVSADSISMVIAGGTKTRVCPDGWARHRKTGRCRKKSCGEGRVRDRRSGKCKKKLGPCKPGFVRSRKKPRHCKRSPCRKGQVRDKATKECRKSLRPRRSPAKKSSRRRSDRKSRSRRKSCKPSQFRSRSTGRCRRKSCKKGQVRDQKSKKCRKSRKKSRRRRSRSRR